MVEKPTEGRCSKCGSENLEFYDDGYGECMDCGRTFRWAQDKARASERRSKKERGTERKPSREQRAKKTPKRESKPPAQKKEAPAARSTPSSTSMGVSRSTTRDTTERRSEKKSTAFLWITIVGFVAMIVGYALLSMTSMGLDIDPDVMIKLRGAYLLLSTVGVLIIGLGLVMGGATADHLDDKIRAWMFIAMALLVGMFLSLNFMLMGMIGSPVG